MNSFALTSPLADPDQLDLPDVDGFLRDALVHEEDIKAHLEKIKEHVDYANRRINQASEGSEAEAERFQAEFMEQLGGELSTAELSKIVEQTYQDTLASIKKLNQLDSLPRMTWDAMMLEPELIGRCLAGAVALPLIAYGVFTVGPMVGGLGLAEYWIGGGAAISGAIHAGGLAVLGGAAGTASVSDLKQAIDQANHAVDELGGLAAKLEEACSHLDAAIARTSEDVA